VAYACIYGKVSMVKNQFEYADVCMHGLRYSYVSLIRNSVTGP
jgi:hypothetical protein